MNLSLFETANALLQSKENILYAYMFGSHVTGNVTAMSDLDLAVYTTPATTPDELMKLQSELMEAVRMKRVDLVDLRRASPVLAYEIVSSGKLLFTKDSEAVNHFERKAFLHYFDTQHLRDVQNYYLRARFTAS